MRCVCAIGALAGLVGSASAQLNLLGSFDPPQGGAINSIGFDRGTDEVFVHFNFTTTVSVYTRTGTFLRSISKPSGVGGNDDDLEFADVPVAIGGTSVPANALLVVENDNDPPRIVAGRATDGSVLAEQDFNGQTVGAWVGGSYHYTRQTFFCADYALDALEEVNANNGDLLNTIMINPEGSPQFDIYYGDVDSLRADGNLYVVSDAQDFIRVLTPNGAWAGDIDVSAFGVSSMAGIAFDDGRGEAWICSQNGVVYHLGGFQAFTADPCSGADYAVPYGHLDFFDVQLFLQLFSAHDALADLNHDSAFDFFDVQVFLQLFSAGCP